MNWSDYPTNVVGIAAPEQHQKSALVIGPASIKLDEYSMRFPAQAEIVVDPDRLPDYHPMRSDFDELDPRVAIWQQIAGETCDGCRAAFKGETSRLMISSS